MGNFGKLLSLGLLVAGVGGGFSASAQQENDVIELLRSQIKTDRKAVVAANMTIAENRAEDFWIVYREYHGARDGLVDRRVKLLTEFRDNRVGMTAAQAKQITRDAFKLEKDIAGLKYDYIANFENVLGPQATLRYFQIENKLDTIINYELASVVPLKQ